MPGTNLAVADRNDITPLEEHPALPANQNQPPAFGRGMIDQRTSAGAVAIEQSRAVADAQGALIIAKNFPRSTVKAHAEMMEACSIPALAVQAFYSFPKGSQQVSGPSIRLAEELARIWGNIEFGHRELSRTDDCSEVEVFCWDKETNTKSIQQFTVKHIIDTKYGGKRITSERDIDDLISNKAGRRLRSRIMAIIPKWLSQDAQDACKRTLAGASEENPVVRVRKMVAAFGKFGVTADHLEAYLEKPIDQTLVDDLVTLTGIYNAIREGDAASRWFGADAKPEGDTPDTAAAIAGGLKAAQETVARTEAEPARASAEPERNPPAGPARMPAGDAF